MSRQSWSSNEDEAIIKLVQRYGIDDWTRIAIQLKEELGVQKRTGKQCRERWYNHLSPHVNKQPWTEEQEELLFTHHKSYGNRWKDISKLFVGRTDNDIKNHFYSTLRRSLRRLNKIVGEKNSTTQMRQIKPSVLSTIMNYIYQQQHSSSDLVESLKDLPILIFEFAKFKPIKVNIKHANIDSIREQTNEIFSLISRFNEQYEESKEFRRCLKTERRLKKLSLSRIESEQADYSVKMEEMSPQSEQIQVKEEFVESEEVKVKLEETFEGKGYHIDNKNIDKTEFSLHPCHYESYHDEETPLGLLNHLVASPQATIREVPANFPSHHHRTFSLEADDIHDMHFNEPEQPSRMNIEQNCDFELPNVLFDEKAREAQNNELIDEVIETRFDR